MEKSSSDQLTLLVFKDNQSPRTFQVSLRWLARVGFLSVGWITLTVIVSFLAIRFYRQARINQASDPEHLHALEAQIAALKAQPIPTATVTSAAPVAAASAPLPAASSTASATPGSSPVPALLFQALPPQAMLAQSPVSIKLLSLRSRWVKHKLVVNFNLEYAGPEGGNQAGRIIILARGGSTLLSYPGDVFNSTDENSLINVEKGEYFSVSRFRETTAQFSSVSAEGSIKEIEILIFGQNQTLLIDRKIKAGTKSGGEIATPPATDTQESSKDDSKDDDSKEDDSSE
jgi:hypothetical protein